MFPFLMIGMPEMIVIALVILLLFGAGRIPALMRSLGAGVNSFKKGMAEGEVAQDKKEESKSESNKEEK